MYNAAYEIHVLTIYSNLNFDEVERTLNFSLIPVKNTISFELAIAKNVSNFLPTYRFLTKQSMDLKTSSIEFSLELQTILYIESMRLCASFLEQLW